MAKNENKGASKKILIQGVTTTGETFRPSDWAERVSGPLQTFKNMRVAYSPLLQPVEKGGYKCVMLDPELKHSNPELYQSILDFAARNNLQICKEDE